MGRARFGSPWFVVTAALFAAGLLLLIALAIADEDLANARDDFPLLLLALAAAAALLGWRDVRGRFADEEALRAEEAALRTRREEIGELLKKREDELSDERRRRQHLERCHQVERKWALELRRKIVELQHERGALGDASDVPTLVLRTSIALVGAEKGLLLSRLDADDDGDLDLIAVHGFDHDPDGSVIAQRFAREVIARDEIVRDDEPPKDSPDPADREIENLVAIPIYLRDDFAGVVVCANKPGGFHEHPSEVLLALGDHAGAVLQNARLHGELRGSYLSTVAMLGEAIEACDPFLRGHSQDVSRYVSGVAERLGMDDRRREELVFGSLLHDVGKIGITERILLKPAGLTTEERAVIELHPRIGYRLVQQVPALRPIAPAVLHHHERFDGTGYPSGLAGQDIPLEARVIAVADSFSAMTSDRPYRPRMSLEAACAELERCAGTQFDPEIVRLFVDEVRAHPLAQDGDGLAPALADPEIEVRRAADEPLLGFGSIAATDNLTLLYSHRHFHEVAHAEAERSAVQRRPFAVLLVELTDLPRVNAEEGYASGDDAIREVARCVQAVGIECGGTACRYSGRRIGLIVPGGDDAVADRLSEQIASGLAEGPSVRIAAATWQNGDSGDAVVARARAELGASLLDRV